MFEQLQQENGGKRNPCIIEILIGNMGKNKFSEKKSSYPLIRDKLAVAQGLPARYQLKSFTHSASISVCVHNAQ
jgi:hypothetical protein